MKRPDDLEINDLRSYRFGGFELDLVDETLRRGDETVNISRRMFQVLLLLVERSGEIVSKEEFFETVWSGSFVEDNNLTVTIAALRKVLDDDPKQPRFIENVPRKGYRFVVSVDVAEGAGTPARFAATAEALAATQPVSRRRVLLFGAAGIVLVMLLSIASLSFKPFWQPKPAPRRIGSIAVLPFQGQNSAPDYVADGMTDGVSNALSKVPGLRVIDRNSTSHYQDANTDAASAGHDLNVESVVTGRIESQSDIPLVTVELTDISGESKVWRQQFRLPQGGQLAALSEIVRSIMQNLNRGDEQALTAKPPTDSPEAYDLYVQGRYYWNKRTDADISRSAELFKAAVDKDPTFAKAYIGLADAYALGSFATIGIPTEKRTALARSYVRKALEIDDTLGEGYAAIAIEQSYSDWDFAAAEQNYRRAIQLSPNSATAHHWYAEFLSMQGDFSESAEEYARAIDLDPLSLPIRVDMALMLYYARDYERASVLLEQAKAMDPNYQRTYEFDSWILREQGKFEESTRMMEKVYELEYQGEKGIATLAYFKNNIASLRDGAAADGARGYWRAMADSEITHMAGPYYGAVAYAKLGENDEAFKYLEKAFAQHYTGMVWLKVDPEIEDLRKDPRYTEMLRRVGLG